VRDRRAAALRGLDLDLAQPVRRKVYYGNAIRMLRLKIPAAAAGKPEPGRKR